MQDESQHNDNYDLIRKFEYTRYSLSPYVGKLIKDHIALGVRLSISSNDPETQSGYIDNFRVTEEDAFNIGTSVFIKKFWAINDLLMKKWEGS